MLHFRPETVVDEPLSPMAIKVRNDLPSARNILPIGSYIQTSDLDLVRVGGFPSTTRQALPSDAVVRTAFRFVEPMVRRDEARTPRTNAAMLELDLS